ncbi:nitrate regulatory gene2 protein [Tanacetum coccineum]|uniref:Nitrate regulatory gene2 protein n=1 Tax=Tanacetum coccineum TaxID=301880 RepID=A0ABQ5J435_9ASTR
MLSSSFKKWIGAQKAYAQSLNGWLHKCVLLQQSTRKKRCHQPSLRDYGPPIYVTYGVWLERLENLPTKEVADSIKELHVNHSDDPAGVNLLHEDVLDDRNTNFDRLKSRLEGFLGQLSRFSGSSVEMFTDLQKAIEDWKLIYARIHSQS